MLVLVLLLLFSLLCEHILFILIFKSRHAIFIMTLWFSRIWFCCCCCVCMCMCVIFFPISEKSINLCIFNIIINDFVGRNMYDVHSYDKQFIWSENRRDFCFWVVCLFVLKWMIVHIFNNVIPFKRCQMYNIQLWTTMKKTGNWYLSLIKSAYERSLDYQIFGKLFLSDVEINLLGCFCFFSEKSAGVGSLITFFPYKVYTDL